LEVAANNLVKESCELLRASRRSSIELLARVDAELSELAPDDYARGYLTEFRTRVSENVMAATDALQRNCGE
jgi:hypothetical protein